MYMDNHHHLKQPTLTINNNSTNVQLLPGFRFHPSDEELIVHYLKNKSLSRPIPASIVADIDLYKHNPWELPMKALFGEDEWYFFSPRDRKYRNGSRPNRAAGLGYWKATGTDKPILTSSGLQSIGVKKALVFYKGRPPRGTKTNWVMHEYRLLDSMIKPSSRPRSSSATSMRLDDWVLCRVWQKDNGQQRNSWEGPHHSFNTNSIAQPFEQEELQTRLNNKLFTSTISTTITADDHQPGFDHIFANYLRNDCPVLTSILANNSTNNFHFHGDAPAEDISDVGSSDTSVLFNQPVKRKSSMVMNYDYERLLYSANMKKINNNISSATGDHSETADENNQPSPSSNNINGKQGGSSSSSSRNTVVSFTEQSYYLEPQFNILNNNANAFHRE